MQVPINVELPHQKILKFDELCNGDVEITIQFHGNSFWHVTERFCHNGPLTEKIIVPKNRRCLIAGWLVGDRHETDV